MSTARPPTTEQTVRLFARCVFDDDDIVEIRYLPGGEQTWHKAIELTARCMTFCIAGGNGQNVYVGANPRKQKGGSKKDDVALARCLFADIDDTADVELARQRIADAGLPTPTITITSGHGVHFYWRLNQPITDLAKWIRLQKALIAALKSDKSIHDPPRIMRLPGTLNVKAEPYVECEIIEADPERRYPLGELADALRPFVERQQEFKRPSGHQGNGHHDRGDWRMEFARKRLAKIGPAVSGQGGHDRTFNAACELFRCRLSKDEAWRLLLEYNVTCDPPWSDYELRHKLDDAQAEVERDGKYYDPPSHNGRGGGSNTRAGNTSASTGGVEIFQLALTDLGNAERLVGRHGDDLLYCHPWSKWLAWDGKRWRLDDTAEVDRRAQETIRSIDAEVMGAGDPEYRKALRAWAIKCEDAHRLGAMMQLARSQPGVPVLPADLDSDPWLLNVVNGTVDLRTGRLRDHRRDDRITKLCPAEYLPANEVEAPLWSQFLDDVFCGDEAVICFVQRLLGYSLTGVTREHVLPIFWGSGSNGKSTLLDTIGEVMGEDYGGKAAADLLVEKRGDRHPTDVADLHGKRLVLASETDGGRRLAEGIVKRLTGDGKVKARRMREDFWQFEPTHKLVLVTNHKPIVRGRDLGIWRRLLLVPFTATFQGDGCDPSMPQKLLAERDGILRWLVDGCLAWQQQGLDPPDSVRAATAEYRESQDTIKQFMDERCERHADYVVKAGDLFKAYKQWCEDRNERTITMRAFGDAMVEMDIPKERKMTGWHYVGITVRGEG